MYFLRRTVFRRLSRLGIDYYDRELPGKVAARVIYDLDVLAEFLQRLAFLATLVIAQFVIAVTVMIVLSPRVIVPVAVATVAVVVLSVVMVPRLGRVIAAQRDRLGEVTARFEEDFAARHEIRRYGAGARRVQGFVTVAWALRQAQRKVQVVSLSFGSGLRLIGDVMSAVVLATAGAAVVAMDSTVGVALTLQLLATQATQPLNTIGSLFSAGQRGLVSGYRLREPCAAPVRPVEHPEAAPVGSVDPTVRFERVSFRYPGTERVVLPDLDLVLDADRSVALVGYTGAGKSSVAKLLMRTYDPDAGRVLVGGRDLRTMPIREYRRCVGVVPQDAFLFKGTVHSNISYGEPGASRAAVEAAAREVGAWEALSQLPGGFDHDVQEEAHNLTGAQQQLVALARAWMTRPRIMILDEATSALDAPLERAVLTAVTRLDCTTLMVTHRETVAQAADEVIVLDAGRIVDAGPPASLIGAGGPYDRLWAAPDVRAPRGTGDRAAGTTGDG
jgi:ATP-binding cassette subfamily B protein